MTAFFAHKALLPGGWTDNVRLTVDSRLDALVFSGYPLPVERVMVDGKWCVADAVHVDRDRAREESAETLKSLGAPS